MLHEQIKAITGLDVYPTSVTDTEGVKYFLARRGSEKFVGCVGAGKISGVKTGEMAGEEILVGPTDPANAEAIRTALPHTAPKRIGLDTSVGLGDRLGLATPGHIHAARDKGLAVVLAQQSIREMTRTDRTPQDVMDCATWGVLQEGFRDGFGADADHLQHPEDIDVTAAVGFTMFTIDPGSHVNNQADTMEAALLAKAYQALDFETLQTTADDLRRTYGAKSFPLDGGGTIAFDETTLLRAAVKYGNAVAHTVQMVRHLQATARGDFELEVSVDETQSPTSPAEHYFFAGELKRLGVEWISMAPRFVGRFEKGVDYIGDLDTFRKSFAEHAAVMRTLGPYKMSIHSGSDKFSIYPIVSELADGLVHLKTAGTSYLEALRAIGRIDPPLFRAILDFARNRYEIDKATYHVSAVLANVPPATDLTDEQLPELLEDFHARQVLHVTFGSVLTAEGGRTFRRKIFSALKGAEEDHYAVLARHIARHVAPFVRAK